MNKLLILTAALLCGCSNADANILHEKFVIEGNNNNLYTECVNHIEYVVVNAEYTNGITLSVDKNGKPVQCNY